MSVPGFLMISNNDYTVEETILGVGGMGNVRKGTLVNQILVKKHGFKDLAVKFYDCKITYF